MMKFFQCKLNLHYNTSSKAAQLEILVEAEIEDKAIEKVKAYYHNIIRHPKKTVYLYNKKLDNYVPTICDAENNDSRLISVDIISIKEANICCFWGLPNSNIYLAKVYLDYITVKSIQQIAIGANDFKAAYTILISSLENSRKCAHHLVLEKYLGNITDYDYEHFCYDITSLQKSKLNILQYSDK